MVTSNYNAPGVEIIGSVHDLTLIVPIIPGKPKIIGGDLDGIKLKLGKQLYPLGYS